MCKYYMVSVARSYADESLQLVTTLFLTDVARRKKNLSLRDLDLCDKYPCSPSRIRAT